MRTFRCRSASRRSSSAAAALRAAIEQMLQAHAPIGDAAVAQLYQDHVVGGNAATVQRIGSELNKVMTRIASSASHAGTRAGRFGAQLDDLSAALRSNDVATL